MRRVNNGKIRDYMRIMGIKNHGKIGENESVLRRENNGKIRDYMRIMEIKNDGKMMEK